MLVWGNEQESAAETTLSKRLDKSLKECDSNMVHQMWWKDFYSSCSTQPRKTITRVLCYSVQEWRHKGFNWTFVISFSKNTVIRSIQKHIRRE